MSTKGRTIAVDLSGNSTKGLACAFNGGAETAAVNAAAGTESIGIFTDTVTLVSGNPAHVQLDGIAKDCVFGEALDKMASVTNNGSGKLVAPSGDPGDIVPCLGYAYDASSGADDTGRVLLHRHHVQI